MLMSSNDAGGVCVCVGVWRGHSNKLVVTAVMGLLLLLIIKNKKTLHEQRGRDDTPKVAV